MKQNNSVFAWIWCISQPYKDYKDADTNPDEKVVEILTTCRWDNSFGAIGGKVDEGEGLMKALYRECEEETGANFNLLPVEFLHLSSRNYGEQQIHAYHAQVSEEDMNLIMSMTSNATHYRAESCGFVRLRIPLTKLFYGFHYANARTLPWTATAIYELDDLLCVISDKFYDGEFK